MTVRMKRCAWVVMIALAWVTMTGVVAHAQLSLSAAVDLALKADPRVHMAQADLDKAHATLAQAKDAYVPNMSMTGGYGSSTGVPLNLPVVFSINSQSLLFNFSQKDTVRAAEAGKKAAELALKEAKQKVMEDAVLTYVQLDSAQQKLDAVKEQFGYAQRLRQIVSDRVSGGLDSTADLHRANQTADKLDVQVSIAQSDMAVEQDHLARMVGLPGTPLATVSSSIPALPDPQTFSGSSYVSFGIRSAFESAKSVQEQAFGEGRYKWRPQIGFGANYSRVSTAHTNYSLYYPGFNDNQNPKSDNSLSVGISITIPLYDKLHDDRFHGAQADANHARAVAEDARNQFLEGRVKLQTNASFLEKQVKAANDDKEIAQDDLDAVLTRLNAENGNVSSEQQMSPKDEQNAHIEVQAKKLDLLNNELSLRQAEINLLRQTNGLDDWLKEAAQSPADLSVQPATR
jgi:outer membrane protein TolC